ncbi:hypothetical protein F511_26152 [Dorcoceras hygrometricum]|uniref:Uncharacterized protein n=1 Tax=Dorcoceras hygrometricum TaxID=472368 RepID=A0A2Z7AQE3_9LAMI|nr:hypothetical protein F511_26152 [Dorcoceras hygrometricum]
MSLTQVRRAIIKQQLDSTRYNVICNACKVKVSSQLKEQQISWRSNSCGHNACEYMGATHSSHTQYQKPNKAAQPAGALSS